MCWGVALKWGDPGAGTSAATLETQQKMSQFLGQLKAQLPPENLIQLVSGADATVQAKLQLAFDSV